MKKILLILFAFMAAITLAACDPQAEIKVFKVTYMVDLEVYQIVEETYRSYVTLPEEPIKEGYIFEYWTLDGAQYDISTSIKEDMTLIAFFSGVTDEYTVAFYDDKTVIKSQRVVQNGLATDFTLTKEGYTFKGWYTEDSFSNAFDFSTRVTGNLALYAKWEQNLENPTDPTGPTDPVDYSGYYQSLNGLTGQAFNTELQRIIQSTGKATGSTAEVRKADSYQGSYYLIYTGMGAYGNREHVWPNSKLGSAPKYDLHNLRAANTAVNSSRGNMPFGEGSGSYKNNGGTWYPGDTHVGDVARIVLYIHVRYGLSLSSVGTLDMFLKWHKQDPVDDFEMVRNNNIQEIQQNRNPFIDYPEYVDYLFGTTQKSAYQRQNIVIKLNQPSSDFYRKNVCI